MNFIVAVNDVLKKLKIPVQDNGVLPRLDSLELIDLVTELERAARLEIPTSYVRVEVFASVESIARTLEEVSSRASAR